MMEITQTLNRNSMPSGRADTTRNMMIKDLNGIVFGVQNLQACIVGDSRCGKSTILKVLKTGALITDLPRVIDKFWVDLPTLKPGKINCHMLVYDTDGNKDTKVDDRRDIYGSSDVVVLCFAVDNPTSFFNIKEKWLKELQMVCKDKPFVLVGNKSDTRVDKKRMLEMEDNGIEYVSELEGLALCEEIGAKAYIESSAYCNIGVKAMFQECVNAIWPKVDYNFVTTPESDSHHCCIIQ